jgi:hypothetical protein
VKYDKNTYRFVTLAVFEARDGLDLAAMAAESDTGAE